MDDTGGRQQPVIPLQDAKGYVIGYATNTTTAYVGTNIHSSSSTTSSENLTSATNSAHVGGTGANAGVVGAGVSISADLSAVISQQALHLKQVQELIAAQSAQIAAWGQLLSVLLQGGQLTSIQSLQGTEVGVNLSQIIASLTLSGGISQSTVQNAGVAAGTGVGGAQTVTSGSNTIQNGISESGTSGITNSVNSGSSIGLGKAPSVTYPSFTGTGSNHAGNASSHIDNAISKGVSSSAGTGGAIGAGGSTSSAVTVTTNQIAAAAAQASSAGHASGYESGHAAGFAAGFKACQSQITSTSTSNGGYDLPGRISSVNIGAQPGVGLASNSTSTSQAQTSSSSGNVQGGGYGATIQIDGTGQQGLSGSNMSWDQAKARFGSYGGNLSSGAGGQSNNSYSISTGGGGGGQSSGYTVSYGAGGSGSSSGSANLSATITAGQGGTVNAGRMTFNNTTFSAAVSDVAARRATWLSQSGDSRSHQEILMGILQSCLNEGRLTLSAGVQSSLSPMIVGGQGGTINAGQLMISGQTFGAFVDKASTMRSQQLASLGDMRPIKEIYSGVFSALLAELEESMGTIRH